jgi:hypothetical protein
MTSPLELDDLVADAADAIFRADARREAFRKSQPGIGPFGEPQLVKLIADELNQDRKYEGKARTKRSSDLLIPKQWAIEVKIARPFGDNGKQAENWSVNLLHPYAGNVSTIGDCLKLLAYSGPERKAVLVIGYEHMPPQISLTPLIDSFEVIAKQVLKIVLSDRVEVQRNGLVHPIHQSLRVFAWEVLGQLPG